MEVTQIKALQIAKMADRILHNPGNYKGGILEMTFVLDCSLQKDEFLDGMKNIIQALKKSSDIFRNVRLNFVYWSSDDHYDSTTIPMPFLLSGICFEDYESIDQTKKYDDLFAYLKKFQARSRIVMLFDSGKNIAEDMQEVKNQLSPFLKGKLLIIRDEIVTGTQIFLQSEIDINK